MSDKHRAPTDRGRPVKLSRAREVELVEAQLREGD
jgi:hypothetical protein